MRFRFLGLCFVVVTVAQGCHSPECVDIDFDGYGPHCRAGADCDTKNPSRNVDCVGVPPPDCNATPEAPGCPCFPGTVASCYLGAADTEGVGVCKHGLAACLEDFYGACNGAVVPGIETCDGLDDDCDGRVDEYVLSPCGGCDSSCTGAVWGPGGTPYVLDASLVQTSTGALTLARVPTSSDGVWLTNDADDTVSHISATSVTEVARHSSGGDEPTRVAVDYVGDVFVANAAFGAQGSITKIGGTLASCVDRNGINGIETSTGPNVVPAAASDECVLFNVPVGAAGEVPRAVAVDGSFEPGGGGGGDVWVGLYDGEAVEHLDGETGAFIQRVPLPGMKPFTAAFDAHGYLWVASQEGELARIDRTPATPSVDRTYVNLACYSVYDLAVAEDQTLLATGFGCDHVFRYDRSSHRYSTLSTLESPRGIVADDGVAYSAHADGRLSIVQQNLLQTVAQVDAWALSAMPVESIGVASDSLGFVWMFSAHGGSGGNGVATRIDPVTHAVTHQITVGHGTHTLGDATGRKLRGAFAPLGTTSTVLSGCGDATTVWTAIHTDLEPGAASNVVLEGRWAATAAALSSASFTTLASYPGSGASVDLTSLPTGGVLELRMTLESDARDSAPLVRQIGIQFRCSIE